MLGESLLTIKQVSQYLGRSERVVRQLIADKNLPAIDLNSETGSRKQLKIDPADLRAYLESRKTSTIDQAKPARRRPVGPAKRFI